MLVRDMLNTGSHVCSSIREGLTDLLDIAFIGPNTITNDIFVESEPHDSW